MSFDLTTARQDGVSDEEISNYLRTKHVGFDFDGAVGEYGLDKTVDYLNSKPTTKQPTPVGTKKSSGDLLYNAISQAETGPLENKWVRNSADVASSAYGPAQITYTLAEDFSKRYSNIFSKKEQEYLTRFVDQGKQMINATGPNDPIYGLGGTGTLTTEEDKKLYKSVATKMLRTMNNENQGKLENIWREWRFGKQGSADSTNVDDRYRGEFFNTLKSTGKLKTPKREPIKQPVEPEKKAIIQKLGETIFSASKDAVANVLTAVTSLGDKPTTKEDLILIQEQKEKAELARQQSGRSGFGPQESGYGDDGAAGALLNDLAQKLKDSTPDEIRTQMAESSEGKLLSTDVIQMVDTWGTIVAQQVPNMIAAGSGGPVGAYLFMSAQEKEGFKQEVMSIAEQAGIEIDEGALNLAAEKVGAVNGLIEYVQQVVNIIPIKNIPKKFKKNIVASTLKTLGKKIPKKAGFLIPVLKEASIIASEGGEEILQGANSRNNAIKFINGLDITDEQKAKALEALGGPQTLREGAIGAGVAALTRGGGKAVSGTIGLAKKITDKKSPVKPVTIKQASPDMARQIDEIKIHQKHLSNLMEREVAEEEATKDWMTKAPNEKESLAELYRDLHPFPKTTEEIRAERLTDEEKDIVAGKAVEPVKKETEVIAPVKPVKKTEPIAKEPTKEVKVEKKVTPKPVVKVDSTKSVEKVETKPIEVTKKPTVIEPATEKDQATFKKFVASTAGMVVNQKESVDGKMVVDIKRAGEKLTVTINKEDIKSPRAFKNAITNAFIEKTEAKPTVEKKVEPTEVKEFKDLSETSKVRERFTNMSIERMREYLRTDLRLKDAVDILSDEDVLVVKDMAANKGVKSLTRLTDPEIMRATLQNVRDRGKTDTKIKELEEIEDGAVILDINNPNQKRWVSSKIVVPIPRLAMSAKKVMQRAENISKAEQEVLLDIIKGNEVLYSEHGADLRLLSDKGLVTITLKPNDDKTKFAREGLFVDQLKKLKEGEIEQKSVSLEDVTGVKPASETIAGEAFDEANISSSIEREGEGVEGEIISREAGEELNSSWGEFFNKTVGSTTEKKAPYPRGPVEGVIIKSVPNAVKVALDTSNKFLGVGKRKLDYETAKSETAEYFRDSEDSIHTLFIQTAITRLRKVDNTKLSKEEQATVIETERVLEKYLEYVLPVRKQVSKKEYMKSFEKQVKALDWADNISLPTKHITENIMLAMGETLSEMQVNLRSSGSMNGFYDASANMVGMTRNFRRVSIFAHESGHFYHQNLLTADERSDFAKEYFKKFANAEEVLASLPFPDLAGSNLGYNPSEYFAESFAQNLLQAEDITISPLHKTLFDRALAWAKGVIKNIKKRISIDPIVKRYVDLSLSRKYDEMEHLAGYFEEKTPSAFGEIVFSEDDGIEWSKQGEKQPEKTEQTKIVESALLAESVAQISTAKSVKEAQNHFIDFVVYKMAKGPIRKNMLKTVAAIEKIGDEHYLHATEVVERYEINREKGEVLKEIGKLTKSKNVKALNSEAREKFAEILKDYDLKILNKPAQYDIELLQNLLMNTIDDERIGDTKQIADIKKKIDRLDRDPLARLPLETIKDIRDKLALAKSIDSEIKKSIKEGKDIRREVAEDEINRSLRRFKTIKEDGTRRIDIRFLTKVKEAISKGSRRGVEFISMAETIASVIDDGKVGGFTKNTVKVINKGLNISTKVKQDAADKMKQLVRESGVDVSNWSYNQEAGILNRGYRKEVLTNEFTLPSTNSTLKLSKAEQVGFVRLVKDDGGLNHAINGGVVLDRNVTPVKLTAEDIIYMLDEIDPDVFRVAEAFDKYYEFEGDILNQYTLATRGTKFAIRKNHHPLFVQKVDIDKRKAEFNSADEVRNRINRRGTTPGSVKERQVNAKNAVMIEDIFSTQVRSSKDVGVFTGARV